MKLKRCPFCCGEAQIVKKNRIHSKFAVVCKDKECQGAAIAFRQCKAEAVRIWNNRNLDRPSVWIDETIPQLTKRSFELEDTDLHTSDLLADAAELIEVLEFNVDEARGEYG